MSKLLVLQKRAIRIIFDLPARETTKAYWHKLKWMKIDDRIHYKKAQMIYKALNGLVRQYLRDIYTLISDVQLRPSRHITYSTLYLPTDRNLQIFKDSFQYSSAEIWKTNHYNYLILFIFNVFN